MEREDARGGARVSWSKREDTIFCMRILGVTSHRLLPHDLPGRGFYWEAFEKLPPTLFIRIPRNHVPFTCKRHSLPLKCLEILSHCIMSKSTVSLSKSDPGVNKPTRREFLWICKSMKRKKLKDKSLAPLTRTHLAYNCEAGTR